MANPWLQSKVYTCTSCGGQLLHDAMYQHSQYECPGRRSATTVEQEPEDHPVTGLMPAQPILEEAACGWRASA